jgi:hypothetical protein
VEDFDDALLVVSLALAASAFVALLAAFAVGVHSGRCDLGRVHRALSVTLWSVVAITFGGVAAYSSWLGDFEPGELGEFRVLDVSTDGGWIEVKGTSPGRLDVERRFLIATLDSRWMRLPHRTYARFLEDGRRALLLVADRRGETMIVDYLDLTSGDLEPITTNIMVDGDAYVYMSPSGSRLAIKEQGVLSVYELDDERLVTAVSLPDGFQKSRPLFVDESTIRLYHRSGEAGDWMVSIIEVNADTGTIDRSGSFAVAFEYFWIAWDKDLRYTAVTKYREGSYSRIGNIFDAKTGEFIRPIADFVAFLNDGRVLKIIQDDYGKRSIVVEDPTGENSVEIDLPDARDLSIIGEGVPGNLLLAHSREYSDTPFLHTYQVELFNLETGVTERIGGELTPGFGSEWANGSGWFKSEPAGHLLFWKGERTLVRWDPDRGELVPVVVGKGAG